jgi:uncharacterized SAM-binding protein YcdF (DUF218 family)
MLDALLRQVLLLIQPIGFTWLVLLILAVVLWRSRQRGCAMIAAVLAAVLTVIGSTDVPGWMLRRLEKPWVGFAPAEMPATDAVVVLGGGVEPSIYEVGQLHLSRAGDRFVMGMELLRLGKAKVLVLGGGSAQFGAETKIEADLSRAALLQWKPGAEIVSLGTCDHTRDEALKVAALAQQRGWKRVALVTSANHMTRALAVFRRAGVDAVAAPCNFLTTLSTAPSPARLQVPSWQGFEKVSIWLHEAVGAAIYRRRGWMD